MDLLSRAVSASPSRRATLSGLLAFAGSATVLGSRPAQSEPTPSFRVGTLPFGTADWTIQTILSNGLARAAGIDLVNVPLASNEAARIGFLSGSVDSIVTDLLFAARLRSEGRPIRFLPYSATEGGLIVKPASSIRSVADLKGKSIGVAGGPLDKSWLLLQAAAKKQGLDLSKDARPQFGAPPILALKVENGELDAGLLYWTYVARLKAKGFREVVSVEQIARDLGATGKIALVGFVFHESSAEKTLVAFGDAERKATAMLADDPAAWAKIRPLMKAPDEKTFELLKAAFLRGIPHKSRADEIAEARAFYDIVAKLGGPELVGKATTLPDGLYVDTSIYG